MYKSGISWPTRGLVSKETVVLRRWGREIALTKGLTLETSAFNLFTVANLPYQLS